MNINKNINKLLFAIRHKGIDIKVDTIQFYSNKLEKYCSKYVVYIKELTTNRKGEEVLKYVYQDDFSSKVQLLKYLVEKYKQIGSETDGK